MVEGSLRGQKQGDSEQVRDGHHHGLSSAMQPVIRAAGELSVLQMCAPSSLHLPSLTARLCPHTYFSPLVSVSHNGEEIGEPQ